MKKISPNIMSNLRREFHPNRFSDMSPKMAFLVGGILGEDWARCPNHSEVINPGHLSITSDGYLLSCHGQCFIGSATDWDRNLANLLKLVTMTEGEREAWDTLYNSKVTDWRQGGNAYSRQQPEGGVNDES